jgi:hypothetical protein
MPSFSVSEWEIAEAEGLNDEEIRELMFSSHEAALEDAEFNGWFPPEQAEWMDTLMNQMWNGDYDHCGGLSGFPMAWYELVNKYNNTKVKLPNLDRFGSLLFVVESSYE